MDMYRMVRLDVALQIQVPLERYIRIVAFLHQDLHGAQLLGFVDFLPDLLIRQRPPFDVFRAAVERAETTVRHADIRVVDVPVDDIRDRVVRMLLRSNAVRLRAQFQQWRVRVEVEEIAIHQAARNESEPSGTRPAATSLRKNSVSPARWP